jgi:hypothetical protein
MFQAGMLCAQYYACPELISARYKQVGNMFWLAAADLQCLGLPTTFCGSNCGSMNINGQVFGLTQINPTDGECDSVLKKE